MSEKFEVVISGVSGRFPECDDLITYKQMLYNKENLITYDNRKWPVHYKYKFGEETIPLGTGKYTEIQKFDARVFACSSLLAKCTDIINRKVLEPSFEAILDAGINPASLMGANVGCYMSSTINEVESIKILSRVGGKMYLIGGSKAMLSNRISFALNLTGPSYTYYSGVLGGLEALTAAYQNIAEGRIDAAIVGSSSSIIDPKLSLNFLRMGYLSPDGLCRAFDEDANGYGRSEGAVLMFLQRAEDAKRSYGTLKFSDCFYFGMNPCTFLGYNEDMIETSLREIYSKHGNVNPSEVSFLEMDACGVKRLDEVESKVVAKLFCPGRSEPLLIGSVKSHSGHAEGAAALLSVLKLLFALDTDCIAPNMHFSKPNPNIKALIDGRLKVVSETTKLPGSLVAVNSQSIFGLVGHAVIEQNPIGINESQIAEDQSLPRLLLLCGRTESGVKDILKKIELMPMNKEFIAMTNDIFKTLMNTHVYRGYTILPVSANTSNSVELVNRENRPIWFVFSGMGSQWNGMGKELMNIPIFKNAVNKCDEVLKYKGINIRHILTSDDSTLFDNIVNAFVGIITVQIGLVDIMKALGIEPDGIIGHSVGENACAYADGCLTLEQTVLASYARGMASNEAKTMKGMMASIGRGYKQIRGSLPEGIEVACHNSADNCTLTGPATLVNQLVEKLQKKNIFARAVNVSNIAYHSRHIAPAAPLLLKRLTEVIAVPKQRSSKWICTSLPENRWDEPLAKMCSAEYLTNNLISPVLFEEGCKHIPENAIVIEIAPHGLLQAILKRSLPNSCVNIPLTLRSKNTNSVNFLLSAIGKTFIAGCLPNVNSLYPKIKFPVPRSTPSTSLLASWDHSEIWDDIKPIKDKPLSEEVIKIKLNEGSEFYYIREHRVKNQTIIPLSLYLYLTWHNMLSVLKGEKAENQNLVFENVKVHRDLRITLEKPRGITIMIGHGTGDFEILLENLKDPENPKLIVTGTVQYVFEKYKEVTIDTSRKQTMHRISGQAFYQHLQQIGFELKDHFMNIKELTFSDTDSLGKIKWNKNWVCFLDSIMKMHMYSDFKKKDLQFPSYIRNITIDISYFETLIPGDEIICHKDSTTKIIRCKGFQMVDLECNFPKLNNFLSDEKCIIRLERKRFVPFAEPQLQDNFAFFNLCLQLVVDNAVAAYGPDGKVEVLDFTDKISYTMKKIIKQNSCLKPNILFTSSKNNTDTQNTHFIIVDNFDDVTSFCSSMIWNTHNLFLLVLSSVNNTYSTFSDVFVEITKEIFDGTHMYLYKKINNIEPSPIIINAPDNWVTTLEPELKLSKRRIILLRRNVRIDDLKIILSRKKSNIRLLFILDDDVPNFSIENSFYLNQIQKDLPVSILKSGEWGIYRNLENNAEPNMCDKFFKELNYSKLCLKTVDLKFISNITASCSEDIFNDSVLDIEYSGYFDSRKEIMGLGKCVTSSPGYNPDSYFTWFVPQNWSLEDACSVPLIYLQVYRSLTLITRFQKKYSVLVNSDDLSFTEACIFVLSQKNYDIFVTVADNSEANLLLQKFPSLDLSHLFTRTDCKYEVELKLLTGGKGVDVLINCSSLFQYLEAAINCVSFFGTCIQIGDKSELCGTQLGLYVFLKSISFHFIPKSIKFFFDLPSNTKNQLHLMLDHGIKEGIVQPLSKIIWNASKCDDRGQTKNFKLKRIFEFTDTKNITNNKIKGQLCCDNNHSFIIITNEQASNLWIELIEWLIDLGARKFIIAFDNMSIAPKVSQQINRLLVQKKATFILTTSKKAETFSNATDLITEANSIAPLEAIFFISVVRLGAIVKNMDQASRSFNPVHFVCMFSDGLKECENRKSIGLPAAFIYTNNPIKKFSPLASHMKHILHHMCSDDSHVLYELTDTSDNEGLNTLSTYLSCQLSFDLQQLESVGYKSTDSPDFVEIVSRSIRYSESKNVYPIFIIPSINAELMKPLIKNLMYPVFCATFIENFCSAFETASQLLEIIVKIQPNGPVTIIGETWSGSVAIELASMLQSKKRSVQLFLIEGSPFTWQNYIHTLGEIDTPQFDHNLLKIMLGISLRDGGNKGFNKNSLNWKELLRRHLNNLKLEKHSVKNIMKAVEGIRNKLIMTAQYVPRGERLKHLVLLKQRPSDSTLEKYSFSDEIHLFKEKKYQDFLSTREVARIINDNALYSWWP